jgi:hypothetical protein
MELTQNTGNWKRACSDARSTSRAPNTMQKASAIVVGQEFKKSE